MLSSRIYITSVPATPSPDDTIDIGLGTSAINGTEQTIANENTVPVGVTFSSSAVDYASGLVLGDIPPGQSKFVWFRRTINSNAGAFDNNFLDFEVACDSTA